MIDRLGETPVLQLNLKTGRLRDHRAHCLARAREEALEQVGHDQWQDTNRTGAARGRDELRDLGEIGLAIVAVAREAAQQLFTQTPAVEIPGQRTRSAPVAAVQPFDQLRAVDRDPDRANHSWIGQRRLGVCGQRREQLDRRIERDLERRMLGMLLAHRLHRFVGQREVGTVERCGLVQADDVVGVAGREGDRIDPGRVVAPPVLRANQGELEAVELARRIRAAAAAARHVRRIVAPVVAVEFGRLRTGHPGIGRGVYAGQVPCVGRRCRE